MLSKNFVPVIKCLIFKCRLKNTLVLINSELGQFVYLICQFYNLRLLIFTLGRWKNVCNPNPIYSGEHCMFLRFPKPK